MTTMKAREGQWYADRSNHDVFCVIAVDESDGLIDVRDRYGDIDEFDLDEWDAMDLELCAAPQDWGLALDDHPLEDHPDVEEREDPGENAEDASDSMRAPSAKQPNGPAHHLKSSGTT